MVASFQEDPRFIPFSSDEQRAIAEALSDVDGLLAALEALIAKKRAVKQAAMQQLLTGKSRLPGFSGRVGDEAVWGRSHASKRNWLCPGPHKADQDHTS